MNGPILPGETLATVRAIPTASPPMARTFENCYRFATVSTNYDNAVITHTRDTFNTGKWRSDIADRYGNHISTSTRTDAEMRPIFNHVQLVAECQYTTLATNADYSPYSC
jgi:hypothetical protein